MLAKREYAGFLMTADASPPTEHARLRAWVDGWTEILQPDAVHWCDGSEEEY